MVHDNVEMLDNDYIRIPLIKRRKIKFKGISFKNIRDRWNNFRLNRLKNKLAAKKERLVEMEFENGQVVAGGSRERTERRVLRKTKAIAKLEARIKFLETGEYISEEFVDSRAIKLKNMMMSNLIYNRDCLYSVEESMAEKIVNSDIVPEEYNAEEEAAKIAAKVREIMEQKKANAGAGTTSGDNSQQVEIEDVQHAIDREMDKIKVSGNQSSPARVNRFINEDGSYRLKREDIDEELRITRFDRSKLSVGNDFIASVIPEPDIPPFAEPKQRKAPEVGDARKAITELRCPQSYDFPTVELPTIAEIGEQEPVRTIPVVVPERDGDNEKTGNITPITSDSTPEIGKPSENYEALVARVGILKAERATIGERKAAAEQEARSTEAELRETEARLHDYAETLEKDCNRSLQSVEAQQRTTEEMRSKINSMLAIMEAGEDIFAENTTSERPKLNRY